MTPAFHGPRRPRPKPMSSSQLRAGDVPRGALTAHLLSNGHSVPVGSRDPHVCEIYSPDEGPGPVLPDPHLTNTVLRDSGCPANTAKVQGPQTDIVGMQASERPASFPRENQRVPGNHRRLPECGEDGCSHQGTSEARCFPPTAAEGVGQCPREDTGLHGPGVTTGPLPRTPSSRKNWKPPGACGCSTDSRWFFIFSAAAPAPRRPGCRWHWPSSPCSGTCRAWARGRRNPPWTPSCFPYLECCQGGEGGMWPVGTWPSGTPTRARGPQGAPPSKGPCVPAREGPRGGEVPSEPVLPV